MNSTQKGVDIYAGRQIKSISGKWENWVKICKDNSQVRLLKPRNSTASHSIFHYVGSLLPGPLQQLICDNAARIVGVVIVFIAGVVIILLLL